MKYINNIIEYDKQRKEKETNLKRKKKKEIFH